MLSAKFSRKGAKLNLSSSFRLCVFAGDSLTVQSRAARVAEAWCLRKTNSRRRAVDDAKWVVETCTKQIEPVVPVLHQKPFRPSALPLVRCRGSLLRRAPRNALSEVLFRS